MKVFFLVSFIVVDVEPATEVEPVTETDVAIAETGVPSIHESFVIFEPVIESFVETVVESFVKTVVEFSSCFVFFIAYVPIAYKD